MFREMRRNKQLLENEISIQILEDGVTGVLALLGDEDYPYALPINYVYDSNKIYFHCAKTGHKIDSIKKHQKASFCVIGQDLVIPEEYTTHFRSVIAFGTIRILEDETEIRNSIELLAAKYYPGDTEQGRSDTITSALGHLCMLELSIKHLTGKEAKELARRRAHTV